MQLHQEDWERAFLGISMTLQENQNEFQPLVCTTQQLASGHKRRAKESTRRCQGKSKS